MSYTRITAQQIKEVLYKTTLVEGKDRLPDYYKSFGRLEGIPVIEKIGNDSYRLITYYENYAFYKVDYLDIPFECELKKFDMEEERYLELLKTLFYGKARAASKDKYYIINNLHRTLTVNEISFRSRVQLKKIKGFIYKDDKYKEHLEHAMEIGRNSIMNNVVNYLKSYDIFKVETEEYLLHLGPILTWNYWRIIKFALGNIGTKFSLLPYDKQIEILQEMQNPGLKILNNYFDKRCDEFLFMPNNDNDIPQPTIQ